MVHEEILTQYPDADLAVTVIWMPILPTDARDAWDSELLTDSRVTQWWDAERIVGRWLAQEASLDLEGRGEIVWDAFFLFAAEATWDRAPTHLLAWGMPIVGRIPEPMDALGPLLASPPEAAMRPAALTFADQEEALHGHGTCFVA